MSLMEAGRPGVVAGHDRAGDVLERIAARAGSDLPEPRLLVVLAHPDDEVLAMGARMERLGGSRLLCVTDGAPENGEDAAGHGFGTLPEYREARRAELREVLRLCGLEESCAGVLRVSDGHGGRRVLADQTTAFHLPELTRAVVGAIEEFRPEAVLTHPYEGGHPDHDSTAFAVHAAVRMMGEGGGPVIAEAPFYHAGREGMETGRCLPGNAGASGVSGPEVVCELSPDEAERKRARLGCFVTQRETLAQFGTERERFRVAPGYDFLQPPHAGRLFYEGFSWGVDGARFRELVRAALAELGLAGRMSEAGRL